MKDLLSHDTRLIHVQRNYHCAIEAILHQKLQGSASGNRIRAKECEEMIQSLYENDAFFSQLGAEQEAYFQLEYEEMTQKMSEILGFLGLEIFVAMINQLRRHS